MAPKDKDSNSPTEENTAPSAKASLWKKLQKQVPEKNQAPLLKRTRSAPVGPKHQETVKDIQKEKELHQKGIEAKTPNWSLKLGDKWSWKSLVTAAKESQKDNIPNPTTTNNPAKENSSPDELNQAEKRTRLSSNITRGKARKLAPLIKAIRDEINDPTPEKKIPERPHKIWDDRIKSQKETKAEQGDKSATSSLSRWERLKSFAGIKPTQNEPKNQAPLLKRSRSQIITTADGKEYEQLKTAMEKDKQNKDKPEPKIPLSTQERWDEIMNKTKGKKAQETASAVISPAIRPGPPGPTPQNPNTSKGIDTGHGRY